VKKLCVCVNFVSQEMIVVDWRK